jgi:TPR repeat protein
MDSILGGLGTTHLVDDNLMTEVSHILTNEVIAKVMLEANNTGAENGDANAMNNLGFHYQQGLGVPQDYGKARGWYEKAADKGNDLAMNNLGVIYGNGLGVPQDYGKARGWYEKAAGKGNALAETNLNELFIAEAAGAGRYAEALQLQEALAMKKETAETKREGKPGKETAETLTVVVWYALFAREFTKALAIAERVHALFPDDLVIETNRSHALMFLGRSKESRTLYLVHKGKPLSEQDPRKWERAIADDFAEFRKAGLRHPMMSNIEKELGVSR